MDILVWLLLAGVCGVAVWAEEGQKAFWQDVDGLIDTFQEGQQMPVLLRAIKMLDASSWELGG